MRKSILNIAVILALKKGYTIDDFGNCFRKGNPIKLTNSNNGYSKFNIRDSDKTRVVYVHKMQAFKKFGEKAFQEGTCVRHLNGNAFDNSINNIEIGTLQQNSLDIPKEKRILNASHPKHNHSEILNDYRNGLTYKKIMEKHGITSKGTLSFIINKSIKLKEVA